MPVSSSRSSKRSATPCGSVEAILQGHRSSSASLNQQLLSSAARARAVPAVLTLPQRQ